MPAVGAFDDPAARLSATALLHQSLLAARPNVCLESMIDRHVSHDLVIVPLFETQMRAMPRCRSRTLSRNAVERRFDQLEVVHACAGDHQSQRYPATVGQQAKLDAAFCSIRWIGAELFPDATVPWSSQRPYFATSNRCAAVRRNKRDRRPKAV